MPPDDDIFAVIHTHPDWADPYPGTGDYDTALKYSVYNINPSGTWVLRHGASPTSSPTVLSGQAPTKPPGMRGGGAGGGGCHLKKN